MDLAVLLRNSLRIWSFSAAPNRGLGMARIVYYHACMSVSQEETGGAESEDKLFEMLTKEFGLQGYYPPPIRVKKLARALSLEQIEWGEISITAAVIGYMVATGRICT